MHYARFQVGEVHDDGETQRIAGRGLAGEKFDGDFALRRLQGHGLSTVPPAGSVGLAVFPFGDRARGYLLGLESAGHRPKNQAAGVSVLYGPGGETVSVVQGKVRIVTDLEVVGNVRFSGGTVTHNGKNIGDTHVHGGVIPGGGTTGAPA